MTEQLYFYLPSHWMRRKERKLMGQLESSILVVMPEEYQKCRRSL
jgi:hypothetical protein